MAGLTDALDRLSATQQEWRQHVDGARFNDLLKALYALLRLLVAQAGKCGHYTMPVAHGSERLTLVLDLVGRTAEISNRRLALDDVIHETLMDLADKYLACENFQITSTGYLKSAMILRAHAMARSAYRQLGSGELEDIDPITVIDHSLGSDPDPRIAALWFHSTLQPAHPAWRDLSALSLRHCYVALRWQSGATLTKIARELGVHSSRLTSLKREIIDFLPQLTKGGFIPLSDFASILFAPEAIRQLGLGHPQRRDVQRQHRDHEWLQLRKRILWTAYVQAYRLLRQTTITPGSLDLDCREASANLVMRTETWLAPDRGVVLFVRALCGLSE